MTEETVSGDARPEPTWHMVTYYLSVHPVVTVSGVQKIIPAQFWDAMAAGYANDIYLRLNGAPQQAGFPARQIVQTTIRPCTPYEVPKED